ncbi:PREDICTED: mitochondrial import receptor subunit TOM40 homolog [Amphimedon queenslandica]|uniref:Uncharacterized protein n=1 Tax=Amphimedon queenslandica TaxID=400682 RepID=A0A1X7SYZ2_AMPQE|nr:PREDICTED: mitochondrial import receptor subunit TOM40 homolog [Amphimedon queenslandica]|eukprot:XP_003391395.1 PREDICTED: mitochondrial import receptor subunit TOM40 homolog [Amphimedon queenslandica]
MSAPSPPIASPVPPVVVHTPSPQASSPESPPLKNPGEYEEIGKKTKESILPSSFDGCKLVLQKGLSQHFQTSHTVTLGSSSAPSQWQFGATYVGHNKVGENDFRPVLLGDVGTTGNFTGVFLHQYKNLKLRINAQTQGSKWVGYQGTADYLGQDYTGSLTLANPDVISGSVIAVAQYLQSITSRLSLGTELLIQKGGGMELGALSVGGTYKTSSWEAAAKVGMQWYLSYVQKIPNVKELTLVAECEGSLMSGETVSAIGYRYDVGNGSATFKGKVDSKWTIGALIEKRLDPLPANLLLSGQLNHINNEAKFGVGFMIG